MPFLHPASAECHGLTTFSSYSTLEILHGPVTIAWVSPYPCSNHWASVPGAWKHLSRLSLCVTRTQAHLWGRKGKAQPMSGPSWYNWFEHWKLQGDIGSTVYLHPRLPREGRDCDCWLSFWVCPFAPPMPPCDMPFFFLLFCVSVLLHFHVPTSFCHLVINALTFANFPVPSSCCNNVTTLLFLSLLVV